MTGSEAGSGMRRAAARRCARIVVAFAALAGMTGCAAANNWATKSSMPTHMRAAVKGGGMVSGASGCMREEAAPTLPAVPGVDVDEYIASLLERFSNPRVADTLERLCA